MLATSRNVLFPGHNHLLTIFAGDLEIGHFLSGSHGGYLVNTDFLTFCTANGVLMCGRLDYMLQEVR